MGIGDVFEGLLDIPPEYEDIIMHCRKSVLLNKKDVWAKQYDSDFDVAMGVALKLSALNSSVRVGSPCDEITWTKTTPIIKVFTNFIEWRRMKQAGRFF